MPPPTQDKMRRIQGFTTVELIIGMVVVAVLAAAAIPALLPSIQRYRTRSGADQVAGELRKIQGLAMTSGARHRLYIRNCPSGPSPCKQYRIEQQAAGGVWPASGDTPSTNANVLTNWTDLQRDYSGVRITQLKDAGGIDRGDIIFDSRGASTNTGVTYPLTITVASTAGPQRTVEVRNAGGVRVQ